MDFTGLPGKSPRKGKTKTYLGKLSLWLKRIMEHENVFLFEYGLIVPAVLKCLFRHNMWRLSLPTWRKIIHIYSFLLQSKIFLMYIM